MSTLPVEQDLLVFAGTLQLFALPAVHAKAMNADNTTASLSPGPSPRKAPNHRLQAPNELILAVSWITARMEAIDTRAGQGLQP